MFNTHETPDVSVVMPCFNAANTLKRSVQSIQHQTFTHWDLIIADDGSTDATPSLARAMAARDARIHVIPRPHMGIVGTLQYGCAVARGAFIARMDADDAAHPNRLARQIEFMRTHPDVAICGTGVSMAGEQIGYGRRRYETWINALTTHDAIVRELFVECPIPHPTFCMRREAFETAGGYQEHGWAEDYDLIMRMFFSDMMFGKVCEPLLDWSESPKRLSMCDSRYSPENFRALKRYYLQKCYLREPESFYQWGAGEVGKAWLREWETKPTAVVDINPRKIGRRIHGVEVIWPEALPPAGTSFVVVAVGALTARDEIRAWLNPRGYRELADYLFLA